MSGRLNRCRNMPLSNGEFADEEIARLSEVYNEVLEK
jgi:hypothetical protein